MKLLCYPADGPVFCVLLLLILVHCCYRFLCILLTIFCALVISVYTYVYDFNTGKVETFKDYASATWGYSSEEAVFEGSVLAVSDDASVIVGNYTDESNFYTTIYFMPEK